MAGIGTGTVGMKLPARWAVFGFVFLGVTGAVAGLIVGLLAYPPTAWFAVIEAGLPAAVVGGTLGVLAGLVVEAARRAKRRYRARAQSVYSRPLGRP
jgi:hypothetical protein